MWAASFGRIFLFENCFCTLPIFAMMLFSSSLCHLALYSMSVHGSLGCSYTRWPIWNLTWKNARQFIFKFVNFVVAAPSHLNKCSKCATPTSMQWQHSHSRTFWDISRVIRRHSFVIHRRLKQVKLHKFRFSNARTGTKLGETGDRGSLLMEHLILIQWAVKYWSKTVEQAEHSAEERHFVETSSEPLDNSLHFQCCSLTSVQLCRQEVPESFKKKEYYSSLKQM